jgi:hypothetical protein
MHTSNTKKTISKKEYPCYSDLFLQTTVLTPAKQHQKSSFSKNYVFKKGTVHKRRRRLIIDLRFTLKKVLALKIMPSTKSLTGTTN